MLSYSPGDRDLGLETEYLQSWLWSWHLRSWSWSIGLGCFRDRSV